MTVIDRGRLDERFPRYRAFDPDVPVWCVTPDDTGYIHRFFETSPISPSGRYLALTKFPVEDRVPEPGDVAEIVVVDLASGDRETVAETAGWDTQMGAHVQWGSDTHLFFNDVRTDSWEPYGVKLDLGTHDRIALGGTVYDVSPDGELIASPNLLGTRVTQEGYGVVVPNEALPRNDGAPSDDGVSVTDTETGETELLVSLAEIVDVLDVDCSTYGRGDYYGFHVMWCPEGDRLLFVLRYWPDEGNYWRWVDQLVTMRRDGSNLELAVPAEVWERGGHHVRWTPDGDRLTMNLRLDDDGPLRFVSLRPDGTELAPLTEAVVGSGHPSLHQNGRTLLTDAYLGEDVAYGDGTVPIRLVDVESGTERVPIRVRSEPAYSGPHGVLRVDPHPAWGPSHRFVVYNACRDGKRQVFVADVGDLVGKYSEANRSEFCGKIDLRRPNSAGGKR